MNQFAQKAFKTAVVILNWNGKSMLEQWLGLVVEHSLDASSTVEVVVADNGSTDGSLEYVRSHFPDTVRCIDLERNHGFAEGYNLALAQVDAQYVVLLNSDVEVTPGWLHAMTDYLDAHPEVAGCQPKIRDLNCRSRFEHAGAAGGYIDALGYPFCRGRVLETIEDDYGQYNSTVDVFWATGACLCLRLDVYREVGGLDARFFAHMEEIDLCWRLHHKGYRFVCVGSVEVYHLGGGTLNKSNPHKTYLNYRNNLLMLYKNLPDERLWWVMLLRVFMDYLSALIFLISGKQQDASAVCSARAAFWQMRAEVHVQRREILSTSRTRFFPGLYDGSMVLDYHLFNKKRFTDYFPLLR